MIWWNVCGRNEARVTVRLIFHWPLTRPGIIITMTTHNYPEITNRKPPGQCFTHSNKTMTFWVITALWNSKQTLPAYFPYRFEYPQVSLLSALWVYLVCLKLILNLYPKLIRLITLYWLGITEGGDHHSLPPSPVLLILPSPLMPPLIRFTPSRALRTKSIQIWSFSLFWGFEASQQEIYNN